MTIDFKGFFRNKNRRQRKINKLERLESRRWVNSKWHRFFIMIIEFGYYKILDGLTQGVKQSGQRKPSQSLDASQPYPGSTPVQCHVAGQ